jgi:hypothetical protein
MKRYLALLAAVALFVACNDMTTNGTVLVGDWGTTNLRLLAKTDTATLETPCMSAAFSGPIMVEGDGSFSVVGLVTSSQLAHPEVEHVHLSGIRSGANVMIGFYTGDPTNVPPTVTYTLTPGGYVPTIGCD